MKGLAKQITAAVGFIAIGVTVSLAVALPHQADANPDPGVSYVWRGTNPSGQYCYPWSQFAGWHPCWHDDEQAGDYTAIDYSYPGVGGDEVWLEYTGDFQLFKMEPLPAGYPCTGIRASIYLGSYNQSNYKGDIHYLHIDPNAYWVNREVPYQLIYIGDVSTTQPGCPWDAPHLHQSADVSAGSPFYTNGLGDPTRDNEWVHAIMWQSATGDADGDHWNNRDELYIGTDPFDNCLDNRSDAAWPPDINNDREINIIDVVMFRGHIDCFVGEACYDNRLDLKPDGEVNIADVIVLRPYLKGAGARCT